MCAVACDIKNECSATEMYSVLIYKLLHKYIKTVFLSHALGKGSQAHALPKLYFSCDKLFSGTCSESSVSVIAQSFVLAIRAQKILSASELCCL